MRSSSPDRLFARYRATGEPEALARLFDAVAPQLLAVARHLVRDGSEAEDVVQATFVAAIEAAGRFEPGASVLPWLLGILARQAASARRKGARRVDPERLPERASDDPSLASERSELRQAVAAALARIPEPYERVLALHLAEGKRPEDIARDLGRRPGTVRVQLHRALRLLRRALPAGFATGVASQLRPTRGLAALRSEVLRHAASLPSGSCAAGGAAGLGASSFAGVLFMSKSAWFAAAGVAAALVLTAALLDRRSQGAGAELAAEEPPLHGLATPPPDDGARPPAPAGETPQRIGVASEPGKKLPTPEPGFRLSGRIVTRARQPVADAEVTLWLEPGAAGGPAAPRLLVQPSAPDGTFAFEDLDVALSGLRVRAEGLATLGTIPWEPKDRPLRLLPGESRDLGELVLAPGVLLRGRVVDASTGEGLPGPLFQVHLYPEGTFGEGLRGFVIAVARATGHFELEDRIAYSSETSFEYGFFAATERGIGWARLVLLEGEGDEHDVEIAVHPGATLDVEVVDAAGRPLPGAAVRVHPRFAPFDVLAPFEPEAWVGDEGSLVSRFRSRFRATTGGEGVVRLTSLPLPAPGGTEAAAPVAEYALTVTAPGAAAVAVRTVVLDARLPVRLVVSPFEDGFEIAGAVCDEEGHPVAGAVLSSGLREGLADELGAYRVPIDRAAGERFTLRIAAEGFGAREHEFVVPATGDLEGVHLVLTRRRPVGGEVVDEEGGLVAGAWLSLSRPTDDPSALSDAGRLPGHGLRTGADGRFRFEEATNGPWILFVHPPHGEDGWLGPEHLRVAGGRDDARVVLRRVQEGSASVTVDVFDADTGAPLSPEHVHLASRGDLFEGLRLSASETRRVSGGVVLDALEVGPWRLWVRTGEREPGYVDFDVVQGDGPRRLRLDLGRHGAIAGTVRGVRSETSNPARLSFALEHLASVPGGSAWESTARTTGIVDLAPDGGFRLEELRPGRYLLKLHYGYLRAEELVELAPGGTAWVELAPEPAAWLIVRGSEPTEPGFVRVSVAHPELAWTSDVHYAARADGEFRSGLLVPPGRIVWEVRFRAEDQPSAEPEREVRGTLVLAAGETGEAVAQLPAR